MRLAGVDPTASDPALHLRRWALVGVLLAAEGALLSARLDAAPVEQRLPQWWGALLAQLGVAMPLATAVATAAVLFAGGRLRAEAARVAALIARPRWSWSFLAGHLIAFVLFFQLSVFIFEGDLNQSAVSGLWIWVWGLLGLGALGLSAAIVAPRRALLPLLWGAAKVLPASLVIGVAAWGAGQLTDEWWIPLQRSTMSVVQTLLTQAGQLVVRPGEFVIGTDRFLVEITAKCSGYEGVGLIGVFVGVYLWLFRQRLRFPQALLLLPIGLVMVWCANALRIAALILLGTWISPDIAVMGFHAYSGSLLFCAIALGLVAGAQRSTWFAAAHVPDAAVEAGTATTAYLGPLLAILLTSMLTGLVSSGGFDVLYPLRVLAAGATLYAFRREYSALRWRWSWLAVAAGAVGFGIWIAFAPSVVPLEDADAVPVGLASLPGGWAAFWLIWRVVGAVVTVPIAEELAFRGYLMRRLMVPTFRDVPIGQFSWPSFVISSILFGALHGRFVLGTLCGMIYALMLCRRGELSDAVVAHATTNALLTTYVLLSGNWSVWG